MNKNAKDGQKSHSFTKQDNPVLTELQTTKQKNPYNVHKRQLEVKYSQHLQVLVMKQC